MMNMLADSESLRMAANMMIASGSDQLDDGSKLTMPLYDSWDDEQRRRLVTDFLRKNWESKSQERQAAEIAMMPKECHKCGSHGGKGPMVPSAAAGFTRLICSSCEVQCNTSMGDEEEEADEMVMTVTVRPHPSWCSSWLKPSAPVRIHGLVGKLHLNGKTGTLLALDTAAGRWGLRVDETGECVRIKPSNFTYSTEFTFRLPADGGTPVRVLRERIANKFGNTGMPSQYSLWASEPNLERMEVDAFDERGVLRDRELRDYGVTAAAASASSGCLLIHVLISSVEKTEQPDEPALDPNC